MKPARLVLFKFPSEWRYDNPSLMLCDSVVHPAQDAAQVTSTAELPPPDNQSRLEPMHMVIQR